MPQANLTAVRIASTSTRRREGHLMPPPENGLRERVGYHGKEIERLWEEKASKEALQHAISEISEIKEALQGIQQVMVARPREREKERELAARERKMDRRYMIATALTCAGLIIAAMAILLPALGSG